MSKNVYEELKAVRRERISRLIETIAELNPEARLADGFDDCICGYEKDGRVIYSVPLMIETLMQRDGMEEDEAIEFFEFNIECAYVGEYIPIFMCEE